MNLVRTWLDAAGTPSLERLAKFLKIPVPRERLEDKLARGTVGAEELRRMRLLRRIARWYEKHP